MGIWQYNELYRLIQMLKIGQVFEPQLQVFGSQANAITQLLHNPYDPSQMISICHDGFIKIWDIQTLQQLSKTQIKTPYLTSIISIKEGFLLGIGNGKLLHLSPKLQILESYKIHDDCITDILQLQDCFVTASYDGRVIFLNKQSFEKIKQFQVQNPILQMVKFDSYLYLAGNPSYRLNLKTYQIQEISGNYNNFIVWKNEIFGASQENGITCLKTQEQTLQPCEYMFAFKDTLLMISGGSLGFLEIEQQNLGMSWRVQRVPSLSTSFSVTAALQDGQHIIIANQSSRILRIQLIQNKSD